MTPCVGAGELAAFWWFVGLAFFNWLVIYVVLRPRGKD